MPRRRQKPANVVEMPWTWERYPRLAARGYYNPAVEIKLPIASLRAAGDEEGVKLLMERAANMKARNVIS